MRSAVAAVLYPLNHVKTLLQFGYEPFPLTIGKRWLVVGRDVYFLPNGFSYGMMVFVVIESDVVAGLQPGICKRNSESERCSRVLTRFSSRMWSALQRRSRPA